MRDLLTDLARTLVGDHVCLPSCYFDKGERILNEYFRRCQEEPAPRIDLDDIPMTKAERKIVSHILHCDNSRHGRFRMCCPGYTSVGNRVYLTTYEMACCRYLWKRVANALRLRGLHRFSEANITRELPRSGCLREDARLRNRLDDLADQVCESAACSCGYRVERSAC